MDAGAGAPQEVEVGTLHLGGPEGEVALGGVPGVDEEAEMVAFPANKLLLSHQDNFRQQKQ